MFPLELSHADVTWVGNLGKFRAHWGMLKLSDPPLKVQNVLLVYFSPVCNTFQLVGCLQTVYLHPVSENTHIATTCAAQLTQGVALLP